MSQFKIEKDIPIPEGTGRKGRKYPFKEMEIGDSVFFDGVQKNNLYAAATIFKRRNKGWMYVTKAEENGIRLWRTA